MTSGWKLKSLEEAVVSIDEILTVTGTEENPTFNTFTKVEFPSPTTYKSSSNWILNSTNK